MIKLEPQLACGIDRQQARDRDRCTGDVALGGPLCSYEHVLLKLLEILLL